MLRHHEAAAGVDPHHQVVAAHVGRLDRGELDGAGIVDDDVEAAERLHSLVEGRLDRVLVANVAGDRKRLAAGLGDFRRCGVDCAFKLGMRCHRLGGDGDIGAVGGRLERDRQPNAARSAGDEQGLALQRHVIG